MRVRISHGTTLPTPPSAAGMASARTIVSALRPGMVVAIEPDPPERLTDIRSHLLRAGEQIDRPVRVWIASGRVHATMLPRPPSHQRPPRAS